MLSAMLLPTVWFFFAYAHWQAFQATQKWSLLLICACEALISVLYLARSEPRTVSGHPSDWLLAMGATLLPLFLRPAAWGVSPEGDWLIAAGALLLVLSLLSLNRSLAMVAAKREIKTGGMFRVVRHPVYLSYGLIFTGYVLANTTGFNLAICVATLAGLWARIVREEAHLALDAEYREYMRTVRFRLVPFVL